MAVYGNHQGSGQGDDCYRELIVRMLEAFEETLDIAAYRGMDKISATHHKNGTDFAHLEQRLNKIKKYPHAFSQEKVGRWLGWAQAAVAAHGFMTQEEIHLLNRKYSEG